ncbi:50S ribosomal protein L18 [Candidatus Gracilibacteria bacterium]|nr:50S ribosomal protein L18 [Candidatus Gracilibacteria bacterium]
MLKKILKRKIRHTKIRAKVFGTASRPRFCVYKSNINIYAQLIDDEKGNTLCASSDLKIKKGTKTEKATKVGEEIGKIAIDKGITSCVFDRGGFMYIGRIKALAEAAKAKGLKF